MDIDTTNIQRYTSNHMNQEQTLKDILEIVEFMKENMVLRDELDEKITDIKGEILFIRNEVSGVKTEINDVRNEISDTKNEIMNHMDGFIGLHQKLDIELTSLRSKYSRLEAQIQQLAKHLQVELN